MKIKKLKIFILILTMLLSLSAVVACDSNSDKNGSTPNDVFLAQGVVIENWAQKDGALVGDILEVPESVKLQINENTLVDVESGIIFFPDGNARELSPKLLDMVGTYTLQYQATVDDKTYIGKQSFIVEESNYYLSNNIFSKAEFVQADNLKYGDILKNKKDGIEVTLSKGNYFRFNQPINVYEIAKNNGGIVDVSYAYPVMDTSLVSDDFIYDDKGNVTGCWGSRLGSYFTIKLIDCYDESNYIEFYQWSNQSKRAKIKQTSVGVGLSGEDFCFLKENSGISATVELNGKTYTPIYRERYDEGAPSTAGKYAYSNTYSAFVNGISSFKLNVNTNEVYYGNTFIVDVDHPQVYPDNQFKGFTTGEVYVQYSFENSWTSSPMELYIQSVLGLTGEQLQKVAVSDKKAPEVDIDLEYSDEAEKSIVVAYNQEFKLPNAEVYDVNGGTDYNLSVYYDYYTDNPKMVYLKDGKFIPDKLGVVYTAEYKAIDRFGNANVDSSGRCVDVINMLPAKGDVITYGEEKINSLSSCIPNALPSIDVTSKNINVATKVTVVSPNGEKQDVTDTFDGENYYYIPEYVGKHKVEYVFEDNVYTQLFSYEVDSVDNGNVVFDGKIVVPSVFIKDAIYDLETYYAFVASNEGLIQHEAKLLVSVDGGEFYEIENQHKFKVEGNNNLRFKAKYLDKETEIQECKITDVNFKNNPDVNQGKKIYGNYFVGFNSMNYTDSYVEYKFNGNKTEVLQYATPLVFDAFRLEFEIPKTDVDDLESINIILKEMSNEDRGYVITYTKTSSANSFYYSIKGISDNQTYCMKAVDGTFAGTHVLSISNSVVTSSESVVTTLPGVSSKNIELSVSAPNTKGDFSLFIKNVCGTSFNKNIYEKAPELIYRKPDGYATVGEKYILPAFNISSVFCPISLANLKYSFKDYDGNYLVDIDGNEVKDILGVAQGITIIPEEVKSYRLEFTYDNYGEYLFVQDVSNYVISVMDTNAPTTTFEDGSNADTTVKLNVGKEHVIKNYSVLDDVTAVEDILVKVVIIDENSSVIAWDVKESFTFETAGKYRVVIFAEDGSRNVSRTYYNVLVK